MQNDLQALSPYAFQQMCGALATKVLGARVEVMGPGRDGGRDLYLKGRLTWRGAEQPGEDHTEVVWDGYTVAQIKQKQILDAKPETNASWLWGQIRSELEDWAGPKRGGAVPDYLIFVTNVPLTPTPGSGGHDTIRRNIATWIENLSDGSRDAGESDTAKRLAKRRRIAKIRDWRVWDGNKLDALLIANEGVRRQFKSFLTPGDILAGLALTTDKLPLDQLEDGLRTHARTALTGDSYVYFDEAGAPGSAGIPIEEVAIDLPLIGEGRRRSVISYTLERGDRILTPAMTLDEGPRHLVIAGPPGNGKTTVSKFVVQAYRAAFLMGDDGLSSHQQRVIQGTSETLEQMRTHLPKHRRWPMRVDLAEYAEYGLDEDSTLLRWISRKVSKRLDAGAVTPSALQSWMSQWPWFLVLDGLDEVTTPDTRKRLIRQVVEFVEEADANGRDVFVVLTTRPVGYVENVAPHQFERVDLAELDVRRAIAYGMRATRVRLRDDVEKIERIERELHRAAEDESLRHLMRTPLQILIMTIIVAGAGPLPPDRYSLFWGYYDTVRRRELSKQGPARKLLETHAPAILELHQRVGFELQVASELAGNATAVLSREDLRDIIREVLILEGWNAHDVDSRWRDEIEYAVTHRLVLLAPRGERGYGFDVRSLQELMAARYLVSGETHVVSKRLAVAAPSPHWRNTWVFAAGAIFAERQRHEHADLVQAISELDGKDPSRLSSAFPVAHDLAIDLIDDGMTRNRPVSHRALLNLAVGSFGHPSAHEAVDIARVLVREADHMPESRAVIAEALRDALSGDSLARVNARAIMNKFQVAFNNLQVRASTRGLGTVLGRRRTTPSLGEEQGWREIVQSVRTLTDGDLDPDTVDGFLGAVGLFRGTSQNLDFFANELIASIEEGGSLPTALDIALDSWGRHLPNLMENLRVAVVAPMSRAAVGDHLR